MHRTLALSVLLFCTAVSIAQDKTTTKNNKADIYDNLYEIYQQCSKHRGDSTCISLSDSMRVLARKQGDARAVAMSWAYPLSYYMAHKSEEQFYATADSLMASSEKAGLWSFYYHAISQESVYLLRQDKTAEAIALGEETMKKAYAEDNKNGIYISHYILSNCYQALRLYDKAAEQAEKALQAEIGLPDNEFGNSLMKLAECYYAPYDWQGCLDVINKYENLVQNDRVYSRLLEYKAICSYFSGDKASYKKYSDEAQELYKTVGRSASNLLGVELEGIGQMDEGKLADAEKTFNRIGKPRNYFFLFNLYKKTGDRDRMSAMLDSLNADWIYAQHVLYGADVRKFDLEIENHDLKLKHQQLLALGALTLLAVLFMFGLILFLSVQRSRNKLKKANIVLASQKQQLENQLEEIRKATDASNAKSAFLFNMSHDIRTPMNAIIGFANLTEKQKDNPEMVERYVDKIKNASNYLLSLINNVLDMARIESGKVEVNNEFYDILAPENDASALFEVFAQNKNISFTKSEEIVHRYVMLDKTKIHQIVVNLLSNAVKYTPEGKSVQYSLKEVPCEREGCATFIYKISDTGIGMTPEFVNNIYDLFSRERNTTDSKVEGTGLGMSIVKRLVDILGGTIDLQTEQGRGTTFTVSMTYPIVTDPEKYLNSKDSGSSDVETSLAGKRVLLVEDNELNAEIAISLLEDAGMKVEHAADGKKCCDMLEGADNGYYDLILMDIQMPVMNGYEATKAIRGMSDPEKAGTPIIAMTANAFEEDRKNAMDAGMDGHISKPVDIKIMMKTIREIWSRKGRNK